MKTYIVPNYQRAAAMRYRKDFETGDKVTVVSKVTDMWGIEGQTVIDRDSLHQFPVELQPVLTRHFNL